MGLVATSKIQYRGVPKKLIRSIQEFGNIKNFIETGSYEGETASWASNYFERVLSIEADFTLYNNLRSRDNLKFILGDSSKILSDYLQNNTLLYLDAHYSGGNTFQSFPLISEIQQVNNSGFKDIVIIIDDARFCTSSWNYESYGELPIIISLLSYKNSRYVVIFDDMIISVPYHFKNIVDEFTNVQSKIIFNVYLSQNKFQKKVKQFIFKNYKRVTKRLVFMFSKFKL